MDVEKEKEDEVSLQRIESKGMKKSKKDAELGIQEEQVDLTDFSCT